MHSARAPSPRQQWRAILEAVEHAREQGYWWTFIGNIIGTSGEAARQRYGHKQDL